MLFLLNANSPEDEYKTIKPYLHTHKNIIYKHLNDDPGIYACWNLMIKETESEYITNANVDDRLFPSSIENHTDLLDSSPDIDVAYCLNVCVEAPNPNPCLLTGQELLIPTAEFSIDNMLKGNLPHNHPVWRRSLHDRFGYFNETDYVSGSDWDFWLRCAVNGANMRLIPRRLGVYYKNPEGISTKKENMSRNLEEVERIRSVYTSEIQKRQ